MKIHALLIKILTKTLKKKKIILHELKVEKEKSLKQYKNPFTGYLWLRKQGPKPFLFFTSYGSESK